MNIFKPTWRTYLARLEQRWNTKFRRLPDLLAALQAAHDFFAESGCVASDHGLETPYGYQVAPADADAIFRKARRGGVLTYAEETAYLSYLLNEVAEMDSRKNWVFQLHLGAVRDLRASLLRDLGPDTGGDCSDHHLPVIGPLNPLLNRFDGRLKIVLYCLDPGMTPTLATLTRAYGATVNLGAAWWMNDSPFGMRQQLEYLGTVDLLANFAGMVSDSRKLLSYGSRHEMFRRILADVLGGMVAHGRMPLRVAIKLARNLAYERPKQLFNLA